MTYEWYNICLITDGSTAILQQTRFTSTPALLTIIAARLTSTVQIIRNASY